MFAARTLVYYRLSTGKVKLPQCEGEVFCVFKQFVYCRKLNVDELKAVSGRPPVLQNRSLSYT